MDETFWRVIEKIFSTWGRRNAESTRIITLGNDKAGFTLILLVSASGKIVSIRVIAKGRTKRSLSKFKLPQNIKGNFSETEWINESIMENILDDIKKETNGSPSVLVLDKYDAHETDKIKQRAEQANIKLLFIPAGLTFLRQPLDVSIHGVLKVVSRKLYKQERVKDPTKKFTFIDAVQRMIVSLDRINSNMIKQAFHKSGIVSQ